jgi:hypothetical protein
MTEGAGQRPFFPARCWKQCGLCLEDRPETTGCRNRWTPERIGCQLLAGDALDGHVLDVHVAVIEATGAVPFTIEGKVC